jgi:rhodanese-related sulfurtransferase
MAEGATDALGWPTASATLRLGPTPGGDLALARVATPGHTLDSHALLLGTARGGTLAREDVRFAFCGDTILSGGLGRTNFVVSDPAGLYRSLGQLRGMLAETTVLCPAHDYNNSFATIWATETRENPLLELAVRPGAPALDEFLARKRAIDAELERLESAFQGMVCGVTPAAPTSGEKDADARLTLSELQAVLRQGDAVLIDVREPQEFSMFTAWRGLGLPEGQAPRNVPLSRFVNFMGELAAEGADREVIIICRSGNRSLQAAKSLRRHGLARARSLDGGIAFTVSSIPFPAS